MKRSAPSRARPDGVTGTTAAGAYMMPPRPECSAAPSATSAAPSAVPGRCAGCGAACRRRSWGSWRWSGNSHYYSYDSSSPRSPGFQARAHPARPRPRSRRQVRAHTAAGLRAVGPARGFGTTGHSHGPAVEVGASRPGRGCFSAWHAERRVSASPRIRAAAKRNSSLCLYGSAPPFSRDTRYEALGQCWAGTDGRQRLLRRLRWVPPMWRGQSGRCCAVRCTRAAAKLRARPTAATIVRLRSRSYSHYFFPSHGFGWWSWSRSADAGTRPQAWH